MGNRGSSDGDGRSTFMLRLPFALCKERGIILPKGATPSDAWRALEPYNLNPRTEGERITGIEWNKKKTAEMKAEDRERNRQTTMPEHSPDRTIRIVPGELAGVRAGTPMTFEEADSGSVNPYYGKEGVYGYSDNCQTCVVAFEARLRGFDVRALPDNGNRRIRALSQNTLLAWKKPDGRRIEIVCINNNDPIRQISEKVEEGQRFNMRYTDANYDESHIITVMRTNSELLFYDPQSNDKYTVQSFQEEIKHLTDIEIYRVDNLEFNEILVSYIVKGVR